MAARAAKRKPRLSSRQPVVTHVTKQPTTGTKRKPNLGPLYDPMVTLAGRPLKAAATGMTNAVLQPQIGALKTQAKNVGTQGTALVNNAQSYYRDLAAKEAGAVARQQAIGQLAAGQVQAGGQATDAALKGVVAEVNAGQAADRNLRSGGLEGGNSGQAGAAVLAAGEHNAAYRGATEGQITSATQNWAGLQDAMRSAREMKGGEISGQLLNRVGNQQQDIRSKIADIRGSRGATQMGNLLKLRQQGFDNVATGNALNIKTDALTQAATQKRLDRKNAKQRAKIQARTTRRGQDLSHQDKVAGRNATDAKAGAKDAAKAKADRQKGLKAFQPVQQTLAMIATHFTAPVPGDTTGTKTHPASTAQTRAALLNKGVPIWAIDAAISIRHHGYILPSVARTFPPGVVIPKRYRTAPKTVRRPRPAATSFPHLSGTGAGAVG